MKTYLIAKLCVAAIMGLGGGSHPDPGCSPTQERQIEKIISLCGDSRTCADIVIDRIPR